MTIKSHLSWLDRLSRSCQRVQTVPEHALWITISSSRSKAGWKIIPMEIMKNKGEKNNTWKNVNGAITANIQAAPCSCTSPSPAELQCLLSWQVYETCSSCTDDIADHLRKFAFFIPYCSAQSNANNNESLHASVQITILFLVHSIFIGGRHLRRHFHSPEFLIFDGFLSLEAQKAHFFPPKPCLLNLCEPRSSIATHWLISSLYVSIFRMAPLWRMSNTRKGLL